MNLKERGVTVGDLLIIFIIILSTISLVKTLSKDKKTSFNHNHQEKVPYDSYTLVEIDLKKFPEGDLVAGLIHLVEDSDDMGSPVVDVEIIIDYAKLEKEVNEKINALLKDK